MKYAFPENFWWGSASSALQTEGDSLAGGKSATIWDAWYEQQPWRFHQNIGPAETSTFHQNWQQDIALLQQLNHNSFRTSLSWSRLIPDGSGEVNPEAVTFYNNVIDALLAQGIKPFITLFHFDMPMVMQEKGGWENREVVDAFSRYAQICFDLFGDRVMHWFTFNEPIVPVEGVIFTTSTIPMWSTLNVRQRWPITRYWPMRWPCGPIELGITTAKLASF